MTGELNSQELALYRLIWQRTLASQMADAVGTTVTVRLGATAADGSDAEFGASGTTITFPGYRQVYVESRDEGDGDGAEREALLPPLAVGDAVAVAGLEPRGHATSPPARYTEASLVKRLDELEIGRPSTWASIIQTVQDRGYVWKKGQALVPTWTAFAVVGLLEQHFADLVDYDFTAQLETGLDAIASGDRQKDQWLKSFYFGDDVLPGLKRLVEENLDEIDAAAINTFPIGARRRRARGRRQAGQVRPVRQAGRGHGQRARGPHARRADAGQGHRAARRAEVRRADRRARRAPGVRQERPLRARTSSGAPSDAHPPGFDKPKMASLFKTMILERITMDEAEALLTLPRTLGVDPADGATILANNGRYGPYVQKDKDYRNLENEDQLFTVTLDDALRIFSQPKVFRRGGQNMAAKGPLREFGTDPVSERPVVAKDGKFGVYVTDGETNASIGKGDRIEDMLPERAYELLSIRRETVAAKGGSTAKRTGRAPARKAAAKKKAPAKKAAAKKAAVGGQAVGGEEVGCRAALTG